MFELSSPLALLLLPLPFLAAYLLRPLPVDRSALTVPERIGDAMMQSALGGSARRQARLRQAMLWVTWGLLVLAIAGPRTVAPVSALKISGRDLAIVLDLSGSMVRDDFHLDGAKATRIEAVTRVGAEFARRRAGDRVALIVFGSEAYYAAPFSFDVEAIAKRIEGLTIGISGRATNISDGLGLALKRMATSEAASKVAILLSDGANNAGATDPLGVAGLASEIGVRVHTIALGPKDMATAEPGERGVVDTETLGAIAEISGGETFRVRTTEDLIAVAEALDRLEATDGDGLAAEVFHEYWVWPAALAALLVLGLAWREA
ncbi:MAG: VWA domain-containing protein [Pseudomonadota bacterium]